MRDSPSLKNWCKTESGKTQGLKFHEKKSSTWAMSSESTPRVTEQPSERATSPSGELLASLVEMHTGHCDVEYVDHAIMVQVGLRVP